MLLKDVFCPPFFFLKVQCFCVILKVTVITEILMRKCGVAAVKSVAAEKYKNFLKTVSEVCSHFRRANA